MNGEQQPYREQIVPAGKSELVTRSSQLVRRGLEHLRGTEPVFLRFPTDYAIGWLWIHRRDDPAARGERPTCFSVLDRRGTVDPSCEAKGTVAVPRDSSYSLRLCEGIGDDSLICLKNLTGLVELQADGSKITDGGLAHLESLDRLRVLLLRNTAITDAGLYHLRRLTSLVVLKLSNTGVAGSGLVHLSELPNLAELSLFRCSGVTDNGLVHLRGLRELRALCLEATPITDEGLVHLEALSNLQHLDIYFTRITDDGAARLRRALPNSFVIGRGKRWRFGQ